MTRRKERVNELIREEISDLLKHKIKDPRLPSLITVTEVTTSPDLRQAKVFISVWGSEEEKREALKGLGAACGFLRRNLGRRLSLRYIPELNFVPDESIERGSHLLQLMEQIAAEENKDGHRWHPEPR